MKTFKDLKWMIIVYGVILFSLGVVDFILSIVNFNAALNVVSYIVAACLFVVGIMHILVAFIKDTKAFFKTTLVSGALCISIGIVLMIFPYTLGVLIIYLIAALALVFGAIFLVKFILAIIYRYKGSWIFLYILFATICITLGIIAFVNMNKSELVRQVIFCIMSAVVASIGVAAIVYGIKAINKKEENN